MLIKLLALSAFLPVAPNKFINSGMNSSTTMWGKDSKRILTCLYCNEWNKINVWHSHT